MLGVATLIVVMSVFNGFHQELLDKVLGFSGHATIYEPEFNPVADSDTIKRRLENTPHVKQAIAPRCSKRRDWPLLDRPERVITICFAVG